MKNSKPIIAIIDDEIDMCSMLATLFQKSALRVSFIAHDAEETLLKFRSADPRPDIIMLDHRLQYADSVELMREMLRIEPSTKVIFMSSDAGVRKEVYDAGAVLFLLKPASIKTIMDAIDIVHNNKGKYKHDGFKFVKSGVQG